MARNLACPGSYGDLIGSFAKIWRICPVSSPTTTGHAMQRRRRIDVAAFKVNPDALVAP